MFCGVSVGYADPKNVILTIRCFFFSFAKHGARGLTTLALYVLKEQPQDPKSDHT
jgi:hypothetical protein